MAYAETFKFGRPGQELELTGSLQPFTSDIAMTLGRLEVANENVVGETFVRILRRREVKMNLKIEGATLAQRFAIESLYMIPDTHLSLIYANGHAIYSERYSLLEASRLRLLTNPHIRLDKAYNGIAGAAQVTITGVFPTYHPLGLQDPDDNVFDSFDRATWDVMIDPGGTPGDIYYVNWTYTGSLVKIDSLGIKQYGFQDGDETFEIAISVKGV